MKVGHASHPNRVANNQRDIFNGDPVFTGGRRYLEPYWQVVLVYAAREAKSRSTSVLRSGCISISSDRRSLSGRWDITPAA